MRREPRFIDGGVGVPPSYGGEYPTSSQSKTGGYSITIGGRGNDSSGRTNIGGGGGPTRGPYTSPQQSKYPTSSYSMPPFSTGYGGPSNNSSQSPQSSGNQQGGSQSSQRPGGNSTSSTANRLQNTNTGYASKPGPPF